MLGGRGVFHPLCSHEPFLVCCSLPTSGVTCEPSTCVRSPFQLCDLTLLIDQGAFGQACFIPGIDSHSMWVKGDLSETSLSTWKAFVFKMEEMSGTFNAWAFVAASFIDTRKLIGLFSLFSYLSLAVLLECFLSICTQFYFFWPFFFISPFSVLFSLSVLNILTLNQHF